MSELVGYLRDLQVNEDLQIPKNSKKGYNIPNIDSVFVASGSVSEMIVEDTGDFQSIPEYWRNWLIETEERPNMVFPIILNAYILTTSEYKDQRRREVSYSFTRAMQLIHVLVRGKQNLLKKLYLQVFSGNLKTIHEWLGVHYDSDFATMVNFPSFISISSQFLTRMMVMHIFEIPFRHCPFVQTVLDLPVYSARISADIIFSHSGEIRITLLSKDYLDSALKMLTLRDSMGDCDFFPPLVEICELAHTLVLVFPQKMGFASSPPVDFDFLKDWCDELLDFLPTIKYINVPKILNSKVGNRATVINSQEKDPNCFPFEFLSQVEPVEEIPTPSSSIELDDENELTGSAAPSIRRSSRKRKVTPRFEQWKKKQK